MISYQLFFDLHKMFMVLSSLDILWPYVSLVSVLYHCIVLEVELASFGQRSNTWSSAAVSCPMWGPTHHYLQFFFLYKSFYWTFCSLPAMFDTRSASRWFCWDVKNNNQHNLSQNGFYDWTLPFRSVPFHFLSLFSEGRRDDWTVKYKKIK